jgi:hypothetical protein
LKSQFTSRCHPEQSEGPAAKETRPATHVADPTDSPRARCQLSVVNCPLPLHPKPNAKQSAAPDLQTLTQNRRQPEHSAPNRAAPTVACPSRPPNPQTSSTDATNPHLSQISNLKSHMRIRPPFSIPPTQHSAPFFRHSRNQR